MTSSVMIAGFTLGIAGSLHCVGMCGPLSLALPVAHFTRSKRFLSLLLYQAGRVITYSFIGLLAGLAGRRIYIAGYQQWFSVFLGSLVLLFALLYFLQKRGLRLKFLRRYYSGIQQLIIKAMQYPAGPVTFLFTGLANGLLPCGMVYIALASTLSLTEVHESVLFMAMFGAGTLPAMMLVAYAGQLMRPSIRLSFQKAVPVFITIMGLVLILRGLNLGIPFISPELPAAPGQSIVCHPAN